jgi:hypothetical protein
MRLEEGAREWMRSTGPGAVLDLGHGRRQKEWGEGRRVFFPANQARQTCCPRWHDDLARHVSKNGKKIGWLLCSVANKFLHK